MRDGTGIYTYPPGTPGVAGQTIFSARYNTFLDDLATTLNTVLPINMGGTGSNTGPGAADAIGAVKKTGDTMTGNLTISGASSPTLLLNWTGSPGSANVLSLHNGASRWLLSLGESAAESGSNAGSNFIIYRYSDAGTLIDAPFSITRSTGLTTLTALNVSGGLNVTGGTNLSSLSILGTLTQNNGWTLIGAWNNQSAPPGSSGLGICWNYSGGNQEEALINTYPGGPGGFWFYKSGVANPLLQLNTDEAIFTTNMTVACSAVNLNANSVGVNLKLNSTAASNASGVVQYLRNGTSKFQLALRAGIYGDGSENFLIWNDGLGGALELDKATGDATFYKYVTSFGYRCRTGTNGVYGANFFNMYWTGGSNVNLYIDGTFMGVVAFVSDYRIKKDVADLGSMWDTVKALRPISYTQADYTPPPPTEIKPADPIKLADGTTFQPPPQPPATGPLFQADNIERWGFIAHELQQTMIPTAATGYKDAPDTIQSPNPWTIIAALTKTLQEAMARIEALETAP